MKRFLINKWYSQHADTVAQGTNSKSFQIPCATAPQIVANRYTTVGLYVGVLMKHSLMLFVLMFSSQLFCQNSSRLYFVTAGVGYMPEPLKFATSFSGTYLTGKHQFSAGLEVGQKLTGESSDRFNEYFIMYGRCYSDHLFNFSVLAGISTSTGDWEDSDENDHNYRVIGLPIEAQCMFIPVKFVGIGLKFTKTFRKHDAGPYFMATLNLGKLR